MPTTTSRSKSHKALHHIRPIKTHPRLKWVLGKAVRDRSTPLRNGRHCLVWQGALNSRGYPCMRLNKQCVLVTRFILAVLVRKFKPGEEALHACDNPPCIEPYHLHHGTKSLNMKQMYKRGRRNLQPSTFME